jgi:tRNA uridine 5-carboxymethylaminomethyl modification enzyme
MVPPDEALRQLLSERGESIPQNGVKLFDLLKRANIRYTDLLSIFRSLSPLDWETEERVETLARYDGYIQKQLDQVARNRALENTPLPQDIDYLTLDGLRLEARQKLNKHKPENIGMASRISGVTPADVNVLLIYLKRGFYAQSTAAGKGANE